MENQENLQEDITPQKSKMIWIALPVAVIITALIAGGLVYFWQKSVSDKAITELDEKLIELQEQQEEEIQEVEEIEEEAYPEKQISFVESLMMLAPLDYIVSEVDYYESFETDPIKATEIKPCDTQNLDSLQSPLCFTKITIVESSDIESLDDFVKNNVVLNEYLEQVLEPLAKGKYQNMPFVYTPRQFMCLGTGGENCLRKVFVYHLENGKNVFVEMSYWSYDNGVYVYEPIDEVQKVIDMYENILMGNRFDESDSESQLGFIKSVYDEKGGHYLEIDYVQMLGDGDDKTYPATAACVEDGVCSESQAKCCETDEPNKLVCDEEKCGITKCGVDGACLPNGFYVRNQNPKLRIFEVSEDVVISGYTFGTDFVMDDTGIRVSDVKYPELREFFTSANPDQRSLLCNITIENGKVVRISEQYTP
jgi:hypothetical protein